MAEVDIRSVSKSFGTTRVLKGIDLTVSDGEFVSLVGPSGCGKSTLLRIIAGLEDQSAGDIRIGGQSVGKVRAADRNLSMVFQSYALYPHLSVAENIAVPLRMRQLNAWQRLPLIGALMPGGRSRLRGIRSAVAHAAEALEISQLLDRKPGQLSGGQRQRVALGRAIVRDPAAFLLDEPLSNLDAKLRVQTRAEIAELHRRLGATFIYVTHDQVEAMTMSSRIAVMMDGEILQCDTPETVYNDPQDIRVAEFVGSPKINILPVDVASSGQLSLRGDALPIYVGEDDAGLRMAIRPEKLRLAGENAQVLGVVAHTENLGSELFVQIDSPGLADRIILKAEPAHARVLRVGQPARLGFDPADVLLFNGAGKRVLPVRERVLETAV